MSDKYSCNEPGCDYSTDSKRGLGIHQATHKDEVWKTLVCTECGEEFERRTKDIDRDDRDTDNTFCSKPCKDDFERDGITVDCAWCGGDVYVRPSHTEKMGDYSLDNHFCDKICEKEYKTENWVGEDHPSWDEKVTITCEVCGEERKVKPSKEDKSRYCSTGCRAEGWSVDTIIQECSHCGDDIEIKPYKIRGENTFCRDKPCWQKWLSESRMEEGNPMYNGGREERYGPNWKRQRRKAFDEFGDECWICGVGRDEHFIEHGGDIHIHHITPRRAFVDEGEYDYERGNRLENLVPLCKKHHREWEGIEMRPPSHGTEYPSELSSRVI